uniref:Uncharacterized protein n=1 Tax=Steinernema glaseri TaxID=37863 RepID=A0A1I7ZHR2_9BILA
MEVLWRRGPRVTGTTLGKGSGQEGLCGGVKRRQSEEICRQWESTVDEDRRRSEWRPPASPRLVETVDSRLELRVYFESRSFAQTVQV